MWVGAGDGVFVDEIAGMLKQYFLLLRFGGIYSSARGDPAGADAVREGCRGVGQIQGGIVYRSEGVRIGGPSSRRTGRDPAVFRSGTDSVCIPSPRCTGWGFRESGVSPVPHRRRHRHVRPSPAGEGRRRADDGARITAGARGSVPLRDGDDDVFVSGFDRRPGDHG